MRTPGALDRRFPSLAAGDAGGATAVEMYRSRASIVVRRSLADLIFVENSQGVRRQSLRQQQRQGVAVGFDYGA